MKMILTLGGVVGLSGILHLKKPNKNKKFLSDNRRTENELRFYEVEKREDQIFVTMAAERDGGDADASAEDSPCLVCSKQKEAMKRRAESFL